MSDSVRPHRQQPTRLPRLQDSLGKNTGVGCHFLLQCMKVKSESEVAQSCPTLSNPMDCSLPGSSVHGIFQARVLEWDDIAFSGENWIVMCKRMKLDTYLKSLTTNISKWFKGLNVRLETIKLPEESLERKVSLTLVLAMNFWI